MRAQIFCSAQAFRHVFQTEKFKSLLALMPQKPIWSCVCVCVCVCLSCVFIDSGSLTASCNISMNISVLSLKKWSFLYTFRRAPACTAVWHHTTHVSFRVGLCVFFNVCIPTRGTYSGAYLWNEWTTESFVFFFLVGLFLS